MKPARILALHYPDDARAFAKRINRFLLLWLGWCLLTAGVFAVFYYNSLWPVPEGFFYDPERWESPRWKMQLGLGRTLLGIWAAPVILAAWLKRFEIARYLGYWWREPGSLYVLALIRILHLPFLAVVFWLMPEEQSSMFATLDDTQLEIPPGAVWHSKLLPISTFLYKASVYVGVITASFAVLGLFTRWMLVFNVIAGFYFFGLSNMFGNVLHTHLFMWIPFLLALSPCNRVLALDAIVRRKRMDWLEESVKAGQALKLMQLTVANIFFWAGVYKLWASGLDWMYSESALNQVHLQWIENQDKVPHLRLDLVPGLYQVGALFIMLFEFSFPLLMFTQAGRWVVFISSQVFHIHNMYLLNIYFQKLHELSLSYLPNLDFLYRKKPANLLRQQLPAQVKLSRRHRFYMALGFLFIGINFWFGFFMVHSWPFSAFPSYTILVGSHAEEVKLFGLDGKNEQDFVELWKADSNTFFLSENLTNNYRPLITAWAEGNTADAEQNAKHIVKSWRLGVPATAAFDTVELRWQRFPVKPEAWHKLTHDELIGHCWADTCAIAPPPPYPVPHGPGR